MTFKIQIKVFITLIMFILILGCTAEPEVLIMKDAPDFTLKSITGEKVSLKDFRGDFVLVDFWATWCGPCQMSIPELVHLQEKYRDKDLVILGISLDEPGKVDDIQLQRFIDKYQMNYHVMRGDDDIMMSYFGRASTSIPVMFVVNREGKIVEKVSGFYPGKTEEIIQRLLL
jgi:peroxiredoxin